MIPCGMSSRSGVATLQTARPIHLLLVISENWYEKVYSMCSLQFLIGMFIQYFLLHDLSVLIGILAFRPTLFSI